MKSYRRQISYFYLCLVIYIIGIGIILAFRFEEDAFYPISEWNMYNETPNTYVHYEVEVKLGSNLWVPLAKWQRPPSFLHIDYVHVIKKGFCWNAIDFKKNFLRFQYALEKIVFSEWPQVEYRCVIQDYELENQRLVKSSKAPRIVGPFKGS